MHVDALGITGSRDHAHGTVAVQDGGAVADNYLEAGIGIFGHRSITTPHFWAFYKAWNVPPQNGQFFDLGSANISLTHSFELRDVGATGGSWQLFIDGQPQLQAAVSLSQIEWFTVFNENYNDNNSQCDALHVTYLSSDHTLDLGRFDSQFTACGWQSATNWEVYWATESPFYCPPNVLPPPGGTTPPFPSSPVMN